jgi:hypothetical protein
MTGLDRTAQRVRADAEIGRRLPCGKPERDINLARDDGVFETDYIRHLDHDAYSTSGNVSYGKSRKSIMKS